MKPSIRLATIVAVLAGGCLPASAAANTGHRPNRGHRCRGANLRPTRSNPGLLTRSTLCLIDRVRAAHHLRPLRANRALGRIAAGQSHDMLVGHYFGDNSLSGLTPLARILASTYGRHGSTIAIGQNIGWGTGRQATPASIVHAWMSSAPHREILLNGRYRNIGVGIRQGSPRGQLATLGGTYTVDLAAR